MNSTTISDTVYVVASTTDLPGDEPTTRTFTSYAEARCALAMDIVDTGLLEMGPADAESTADWLAAAADLLRSTGPAWRVDLADGCSFWISASSA